MTIEEEILALQSQLAEKMRLKALEDKKIQINIHSLNVLTGKVTVTLSKFRTDLVDWLRYNTDRYWTGNDNIMSIHFLQPLMEKFSGEDITYTWEKKSFDLFEKLKSAPDISVDISKSWVLLTFGMKMAGKSVYLSKEISSYTQDLFAKEIKFSITELYKFPDAIKKSYPNLEVTYTQKATEELFKQLNRRQAITELANAIDTDLPNPFKPETGRDLKGHQRVAVKFAELSGGSTIIAYDMGTGKTYVGMGYAERHPEHKRVLIVCPASLKTNWKREIKRATGQDAVVFQGVEPDNLAIDYLIDNTSRYFIINFDIIGRKIGEVVEKGVVKEEGVMKWVELFNLIGIDLVIVDEAHYIKNLGSKRSQGVRALKYKSILPMSGTPIVNRPMELWPLLNLVDRQTFNSPSQFADQFVDRNGKPMNTAKLHEIIMPYMIRRTRKDVYGELHVERIPFTKELSPQARIIYEKIMEGVYISLRRPDYQTNVTSILAELIRCKQTCSADNVGVTAELAADAYEDTQKKVIICSQFKESQYAIQNLLGPSAVVINGDVTDDMRYASMDKFQDPASNIKFWITNIPEGLTLTEAHTIIFNDMWWTNKDHAQLEGRCFGRDNDPHGGNSYFVQNENTIDDKILVPMLLLKMAISEEVIDGIRSSGEAEKDLISELLKSLRDGL